MMCYEEWITTLVMVLPLRDVIYWLDFSYGVQQFNS